MGDRNQLTYLKARVPTVDGPVLEVGSREVGTTASFRSFYRGAEYVGIDIEPGEGVDLVRDICADSGEDNGIDCRWDSKFALVICCSVLEHVENPWCAARTLAALTRPGGQVYISVPWVWRYHAYPDDYWRFSWSGVKALFPGFEWGPATFATNIEGEFHEAAPGADNALAYYDGKRKYLPYLMLNMIGTKRE